MFRVTEWANTVEEIQFAYDQIEKYDPDVAVMKQMGTMWSVHRNDMEESYFQNRRIV